MAQGNHEERLPQPKTHLAQRLVKLRQGARLTRYEAAERIGVSHSTLCRWEAGDRVPRPDKFAAIARAYSVPVGFVLSGFNEQ